MFPSIVRDTEGWKTVGRDVRHRDAYTELAIEQVTSPTHSTPRSWTVVHRKAATVIAPLTEQGEFLLIRQERIPVRMAVWEFPAGQIDEVSEQDDAIIRSTALRELLEETGFELSATGALMPLGHFFTSVGFTDEHAHLFLARGVVPSPLGHAHDHGESILECRAFTPKALREMVARSEIFDANTLAVFARLHALGLYPQG